jgi:mono/diheme cytochrome c family protein
MSRRTFAQLHAACLAVCCLAAITPGSALAKADSAAALYHNYCSVCHGDKGDGRSRARASLNPPPKNFTDPALASALPRERMLHVVANGQPGTAMVGWKTQLDARQIETVVDYIRATFMRPVAGHDVPADAGLERGRAVYARTCSVCHGDKGNGASWAAANMRQPPRDFTNPEARSQLSRERMILSVTNGRADTPMPGFGRQLSKQDIDSVVDYIRSAFMGTDGAGISGTYAHGRPEAPHGTAAHDRPADMKAPLPKGLVGNAERGGRFYKANCATCHGVSGDGRGPRAYFINPKPRNFLHAASRAELNRPELFEHISDGVLGTEMPAWDKVLSAQEIADVSEYVFRAFIQPKAGAQR